MKKWFLLLLILLLVACQPTTQEATFDGVVVDEDLVLFEDIGPIMHNLEEIETGSVVQMKYAGVFMDSFPMQIEDSATFTVIGTDEHLVTSIVKIIQKLKNEKPAIFEETSSIGLKVEELKTEYENLILVMLSKHFSNQDIQFNNPDLETQITLYFDDIETHGQNHVIFSLDLISNDKQYYVDQGHLNKNNGLYEVDFYTTTDMTE